ncbi:MAG: hypothetical protein HYX20_02635 [Candidatus Yanofskybacteria bacterium]|nr:hypothetical protein [Candidatus Yanofskybacteria bacterium]
MKRASLLLFVAMFLFINLGFAKDPEIVNPPRPSKPYKELLVVEHLIIGHLGQGYIHQHFFYTDSGWEIIEGIEKGTSYLNFKQPAEHYLINIYGSWSFMESRFLLEGGNEIVIFFARTKGVKPSGKTPTGVTESDPRIKIKKTLMPQRAKVVFK